MTHASLRYVIDENLRGPLRDAICHHNARGPELIDAMRVGDGPDLPLGMLDADLLLWAEREGRILVSRDKTTLPAHLNDHLQAGRRSPGIFVVRARGRLAEVVLFLLYAAFNGDPSEFEDRLVYIP